MPTAITKLASFPLIVEFVIEPEIMPTTSPSVAFALIVLAEMVAAPAPRIPISPELPVIVLRSMVNPPDGALIAPRPPSPIEVLSAIRTPSKVSGPVLKMPAAAEAPAAVATLPVTVESSRVSSPRFVIPAPSRVLVLPLVTSTRAICAEPPLAIVRMGNSGAPPKREISVSAGCPSMVTSSVISGSRLSRLTTDVSIVIVSEPAAAFESRIAWRSVPGPESAAVSTVNGAALAVPADATAQTTASALTKATRRRQRSEPPSGYVVPEPLISRTIPA